MLATLATVKDFTQWTMVLTTIFLVECARREHMHAEQIRTQLTQRGDTGVDFVVSQRPDIGLAAGALSKISGPRLVTMEDGAMQQRLQGNGDVKHEQDRRQMVHAPPQPMAPDASGTTDNHYGNRMTLKRSGNLNHMYESRT